MKKTALIVAVLLSVLNSTNVSAGNPQNVVYLKNGSVIRGTIIEQVPDKVIIIQTADNSIFAYTLDEIEKMTMEQSSVQAELVSNPKVTTRRNPGMAILWSALIPGGGQYYNKQYIKGAIFSALEVGGLITFLVSGPSYYYDYYYGYWYEDGWGAGKYIGMAVMCASFVASVVDAPLSSLMINRRNNLSIHIGPNTNLMVALKPDFSINGFGYTKPFLSFGAKLSVNLQ